MTRFVLLLALGCASAPPPAEPVVVEQNSSGSETTSEEAQLSESQTANIRFSLESATLVDVAHLLGQVSGLRVVLDAEVDRVAGCMTISVFEPNLITVDEAIAVTREAYAPLGVELRRSSAQLVFSLSDDAPRRNCGRDYINPDLMFGSRRRATSSQATPTPQSRSTTQSQQPTAQPQATTQSTGLSAVVVNGIRRVSANEFLITNAALNEVLANQAHVFSAARLIPHEENGRVVSIKVYGIRRNSLLGRLGFRNGDGVQSVNGYDVTSPDSALEAYARVRSASEIRVQLQRRGQSVTQTIRIVQSLP